MKTLTPEKESLCDDLFLNEAASGLSSSQEAMFLKFFGNLSYPDISAVMSIRICTVHNLVSNAVYNLEGKDRA